MARRVNNKFLVFLLALSGGVALIAILGFYVHKTTHNADYKQLEALADEAIKAGELEKGARLLTNARDQAPDNTEILIKLGDTLDRLTAKDPIHLGEARLQWNKAVSVDPHCLPALRALLKSYADELDINPRPEVFVELKRICDRLLNVVPSDLSAQEKKQVAVIHEWLANQTASNDEVRQSIDTYLPELIRKDPENPELPRTLALARIQEARESLNRDDKQNALFVLNDARKMLDAACKGREQNASMQYRAFQSYVKIKQLYPDIKNNVDKQKDYSDRITKCIDLALAAASKMDPATDPLCDEIYQAASEWASQQGKSAEAEKIMRGFYEGHKGDQRARLTMARVLDLKGDSASRDEAVKILKIPVVESPDVTGFRALVQRDLSAQTVAELIRVYLADFSSTPATDPDKRKQIAANIDDRLDALRHLYPPQSVPVLNLEGRYHLLKGENVEAVKTFEQAVLQMSAANMDNDLLFQLARAYTLTGQPGRARQRLEQVILKMDTAVPARVMLAKILLQFSELQAVAVQVRRLKELAPDSPEVKQLEASLALADWKHNPEVAFAVYGQMPETTREERLIKSQVADTMGRPAEAARILEAVLKDAPEDAQQLEKLPQNATEDQRKEAEKKVAQDSQASLKLAQVYANSLGQKETAKRVVDDALKLNPDDPTLVDADARLHDRLPEDIYALVLKAVQKTPDPFTKEMQRFDLESRPGGHPEQAFGHLLAANKLKPDDIRVLDLMFGHYVNQGKLDQNAADQAARQDNMAAARAARDRAKASFDQAVPLVDRLAAQNADQCGGVMYRYRLSLVRGDLAAAEDYGRQLTRDYSEFAAGWLVTAQVLQLRQKYDEAVHFFLEVLNRQPGQYDAYRGLIECYLQLNQPENAEIRLREARAHYPNDPVLREQMLVFLVNYGKAAEAVAERESILADNKQKQKDGPDDYLQLAKAYFHAAQDEAFSKPTDSADNLNKAFQTLSAGRDKFSDDGRFSSQLAEMYLYNRDLDAGEKILKELYDRPDLKDDPEPAMLLSDFYSHAGKLEKSELYLNEAMVKAEKKEGGADLGIRLRLASLQAQQGKFDAAYRTLTNAGTQSQTNPALILQRLEIMIAEGKRDEARKGLQAELAKRDAPELHNLLASLLIDNKELDAAMKELDHVLTIDPRNDAAIYLQSLALARENDIPRAITQLLDVRNRDLRNSQVRMLLAELYSKTGKTDYAVRELEDALQKIPTNREIRLALIQLYRGELPLTNDALNSIIRLCRFAEADPVLRSDPTWAREEALAYASMDPANVPAAIMKWKQVIALAPDKPDFRREFMDLLIEFHDWAAVINETDKLIKDGHDEWWLHYQRGMAFAHLAEKDKSLKEFDNALKVTDLKTAANQGEFIIRGIGENIGHDEALGHVTPLLVSDPDGRWRLLQASELRAEQKFKQAEDIVNAVLAEPVNKPPDRRAPLLRAKADIYQAHADADIKNPAKALAENRQARDAYIELIGYVPDDTIALNNLAYLLAERIPAPEGGPSKAKEYSTKAYELVRFKPAPNILVLDTQGWVLTLCGDDDDAAEGMSILHKLIVDREDTKTFIEGRYHLGEAYLRAKKPDYGSAQRWLKEAMALIANDEKAGRPVDAVLKDKIQTSLAKATGPVTSGQ
jgi:tetratricopeptide (TPR) repeat protein